MKLCWLALSIFTLLSIACSSPHPESDSNPVLIGYNLIDDGKADEAIDHFQFLLEQEPDSAEYRRGLSSAYALRGGFRVQALVKPMQEIRDSDRLKKEFEDVFKRIRESNASIKPFEKTISFEVELVVFLKKFASVPEVSSKQVLDLKTSISLLRSLKETTQGDQLYMAVLETLILKQSLMLPMKATDCDGIISEFQERMQNAARQYGKILTHLKMAQPSQTANYEKQQLGLERISEEISLMTKSSLMSLALVQSASMPDAQIRLLDQVPQCEK